MTNNLRIYNEHTSRNVFFKVVILFRCLASEGMLLSHQSSATSREGTNYLINVLHNPLMVATTYCRSTYLYDTLRPKLIHETNIDFLCELVDILKVEVLGEQLSRRSESLAGLRPTLQRILADVHERLTFRARTHIRDEVTLLNS